MNSKEALKITIYNRGLNDDLDDVMDKIIKASNQGETKIIYDKLDILIIKYLKKLGYKIKRNYIKWS